MVDAQATDTRSLPLRWSSPEALVNYCFSKFHFKRGDCVTSATDVWSYGVVLWEILTLGDLPYSDATHHQIVLKVFLQQLLDFYFKRYYFQVTQKMISFISPILGCIR